MLSRYYRIQNCAEDVKRKWAKKLCSIGDYAAQIGAPLEPISLAVARILRRLHALSVSPDPRLSAQERNRIIKSRFDAGESQAELARIFGISYQRIHQIVRGKNH